MPALKGKSPPRIGWPDKTYEMAVFEFRDRAEADRVDIVRAVLGDRSDAGNRDVFLAEKRYEFRPVEPGHASARDDPQFSGMVEHQGLNTVRGHAVAFPVHAEGAVAILDKPLGVPIQRDLSAPAARLVIEFEMRPLPPFRNTTKS